MKQARPLTEVLLDTKPPLSEPGPIVVISRELLVQSGACQAWLDRFDKLKTKYPGKFRMRWSKGLFLWLAKNEREAGVFLRDILGLSANLIEADLRGANLAGANLRWANLTWADLRGANLIEANLIEADLRGANLAVAYLAEANLTGADLQGANLRGADLRGADLAGANLAGANLAGAYRSDHPPEGWKIVDGKLEKT